MDDFEHPLLQKGRYRLIALSRQPRHAADRVHAYAITTLAGDRLREEPTQARALQWLDARIAGDDAPAFPPTRPRRR